VRLARLSLLAALCVLLTGSSASALDLEVDRQPPPGEVGTPYEFEFEGEEGCLPYRFSYLNGSLPPGLRITEDGRLTGTPTEAGTFTFWVALDDNSGPDNPLCLDPSVQSQGEFTMVVLPDLGVGTSALPRAVPGQPYSYALSATNVELGWPLLWDVAQGTLPAGLTLSESGVISGTPTGADLKTFTVRVREPFRRFGERELTLAVAATLVAEPASLPPGRVGVRVAGSLAARGGLPPLTWTIAAGSLPPGLALDPASGTLRGLPRRSGAFPLTLEVSDASGQRASVDATLRILPSLRIETAALPAATPGRAYRAQLATNGLLRFARVQWTIVGGSLPPGVRLEPWTGTVRGTPRRAGRFRVVVRARELPSRATATRAFVLVVRG
jgi:hypothetical protein